MFDADNPFAGLDDPFGGFSISVGENPFNPIYHPQSPVGQQILQGTPSTFGNGNGFNIADWVKSLPGMSFPTTKAGGAPAPDWLKMIMTALLKGGQLGLGSLGGGGSQAPAPPSASPAAPATPPASIAPTQPMGPSAAENIAAEQKRRQYAAMQARKNLPSLQQQTGDSLSPDYLNALASQLAGVYGDNPGTINPGGFSWMDTAMKGA